MAMVRCTSHVVPARSGRVSGRVRHLVGGGKIGVMAKTGILPRALRGNSKIAVSTRIGKSRRRFSTRGLLISIKHRTGARNVNVRGASVRVRGKFVLMGRCFRAGRSRVCTVNSIVNNLRLTRITSRRKVMTIRRVTNGGPSPVSCDLISGYVCDSPRTTDMKLARSRTGRGNRGIGANGFSFQTVKGTLMFNRSSNFIGVITSGSAGSVLNIRVVNPRIASVVSRTNLTHILSTAP